jgi:hypothetical protein
VARSSWLLWWRIDKGDLDKQVAQYDTLRFPIRKVAAALLLLSATVTMLAIDIDKLDLWSYTDVMLLTILAVFIYFGHRWAMIGAMILWTVNKGIIAYDGIEHTIISLLLQVCIWYIYMRVFYFSFRVEQESKILLMVSPSREGPHPDPNRSRIVKRLSVAKIAIVSIGFVLMMATVMYFSHRQCYDRKLYFMTVPGVQYDGCR